MAVSAERLKPIIPFIAGITLGASVAFLEKKFPRSKLKTKPQIPIVFRIADEVLEFTAMRFLDVLSHHWHWQNIEYTSTFDDFGIDLSCAPKGNPHNNPFFGVIAHLGGRPYGTIVEAEIPSRYRLGFKPPKSDYMRICNIELDHPVMFLAGPMEGCTVFAIDSNDNPVPLKQLSGIIHRNKKPKGIRIL